MKKETKEEKKELQEKLNIIGLNLEKLPNIFQINEKVRYKPQKDYNSSNYKVYHFVDIKDIEIYLTNTSRLDDTEIKYKKCEPIANYLQPENEELLENYIEFIRMLKELDIEKVKEIEEEQEKFQNKTPFNVKYKDDFIWEIYYSELDNKYFMMFSTKEKQPETLFYLIKKQIELQKSKKSQMIYVPINNMDYTNSVLKKSEISDLENYLWYFTKSWPSIYELKEKDKTKNIQILGTVKVYDKIKSTYKMQFNTKEKAQKQFKLIKALFILETNAKEEYNFKTGISENGGLNFYFNHTHLKYENLTQFITNEIQKNQERIEKVIEQNIYETERWILLKETVQKQNLEYVEKEKQIVTFLECRKTFFGRVSYFFKSKKKKVQENKKRELLQENKEKKLEKIEIEEKEFYTLEDLIKICNILQEKEKDLKNKQMDIKSLENKKENLERKIKNATLYINEIESHKKSIFDFWKFTNKDEVPLLLQSEEQEENNKNKIKKVFSYEEDIEDVGKRIDERQRTLFSSKECDAVFAIYQDIESFNIDRKEKKLKKDEKNVEKSLNQNKQEYEKDFEKIEEKDFDIFGNVSEDSTKIKKLNNQKHRERQKDKFKVLDIHPTTTIEEYKDNIHHYEKILEEAYLKMISPYDISVYNISKETIKDKDWVIMELDAKKTINKVQEKEDIFILNRINIKENMPVIFYSNIMFYENLNNTLPQGMDVKTEVLLDLKKYEMKLVSRKDFNISYLKDEFENTVKTIQVYEYNIERRN